MLDGAASIEKTKPHIFTLGSIASRYSWSKLTAPRFHASPIYLFVCLSCCTIVRGHMINDIWHIHTSCHCRETRCSISINTAFHRSFFPTECQCVDTWSFEYWYNYNWFGLDSKTWSCGNFKGLNESE